MNPKKLVALGGATILLTVLTAGAALAAGGPGAALAKTGPAVSVRVEGVRSTLLAPKVVHVRTGWITRFGAPKGACPARSAQGALDAATGHRWRGLWTTRFGPQYEITSILGETHTFASQKYFWEIFAGNRAAVSGACEIRLHRGERLLFAAVPQSGPFEYPLGLTILSRPIVGHRFSVKVVSFGATGKPRPLAGATVTAGGISAEPVPHDRWTAKTNRKGIATLTVDRAGLVEIGASRRGYIRAASVARDVA